MGDVEEARYEGEVYRWSCPWCDDMNEEESDPRGSEVECDLCDYVGRCSS